MLTSFLTASQQEFVPWFHGTLSRKDAEHALIMSVPSQAPSDGTFLVRYSETQPAELVVTYVKIHKEIPKLGQREIKNSLIKNIGPVSRKGDEMERVL